MKTKLLFAILLFAFAQANAQWTKQIPAGATKIYTSIHGIGDTLFAAGPTGILKTFDKGATWLAVSNTGNYGDYTTYPPYMVKMYDKNKIVVCQANSYIRRSLDGGTIWNFIVMGNPGERRFYDVAFLTDTSYVVVGGRMNNSDLTGGNIIKTYNFGASYYGKVNLYTNPAFFGVHSSGNDLIAVGGVKSIHKSSDGGETWTPFMSDTVGNITYFDINFPTDSVGYIVGGKTSSPSNSGIMLKTIDKGQNWTAITLPVPNALYGVHFINKDTGYVVGNGGYILRTTNGGVNWSTQPSGVTTDLNKIYFTSDLMGYIAGNAGVILKTVNGGDISTSVRENDLNKYLILTSPETITIQTASQMKGEEFFLYNTLGQQQMSKRIYGNEISIQTSNLKTGIYFFQAGNCFGKILINE